MNAKDSVDAAHDDAIRMAGRLAQKWAGERRADGDPEGGDVIDDLATAIRAMLKRPKQPSMWAYSVSNARGYPVWETWEEGSQEPPDEQSQITLMASAFPIGTRIQVLEPK